MNPINVSDNKAAQLLENVLAKPVSVLRISEGGEHLAWRVNDDAILRIPVDQSNTAHLDREQKLIDLISQQAPLIAPILPVCVHMGTWSGWRFGIYRRIQGTSIEAAPELVNKNTEEDLSRFLQALHAVPVESAATAGIATDALDTDSISADAAHALARLQSKSQLDDMSGRLADSAISLHTHSKVAAEPVLAHADLKGEHIFVDSAGRLTGVIDWSDAVITHPAVDIAGVAISVGAGGARRIAALAGYSDDVVAMGITLARCNTVVNLDGRLNGGDDSPEWLVRRQLRRAFESMASI